MSQNSLYVLEWIDDSGEDWGSSWYMDYDKPGEPLVLFRTRESAEAFVEMLADKEFAKAEAKFKYATWKANEAIEARDRVRGVLEAEGIDVNKVILQSVFVPHQPVRKVTYKVVEAELQ